MSTYMKTPLIALSSLAILSACQDSAAPPAVSQTLSVERISALIKPAMRKGESADLWASDMLHDLDILKIDATAENVCAVVAVIEQESGFKADPEVAGIRQILAKKISKAEENILTSVALNTRLNQTAANGKSFRDNMTLIHTERDFESWYNEFTAAKYTALGLKYLKKDVGDIITTAGSMQVSVDYAYELAPKIGQSSANIRDTLYSRAGGMLYGSAHLLRYDANYSKMYYRFADYNAGHYASRNAAFQKMVANLTAAKGMGFDGDLLSYKEGSASASNTSKAIAAYAIKQKWPLTIDALMADLKQEKDIAFTQTKTYQLIAEAHQQKFKKILTEQIPSITLKSDKITRKLTTQWYADSVNRRYDGCLKRVGP